MAARARARALRLAVRVRRAGSSTVRLRSRQAPIRRLSGLAGNSRNGWSPLALPWRPVIGLGASAAHQHRPLAVAQALGLDEGPDGVLVVDHGERTRPVRTPQAALETPGIEDARQRIPDVRI